MEKLAAVWNSIQQEIPFVPKVALVLGSGLGEFAAQLQVECTLPYQMIPGFPISTVAGHKGQFLFGHYGSLPVVIMQGRVHYYEGYSMQDVVLPIRLMRQMGAEVLLLTNAAGGCNPSFAPGDFMAITDHIASFVPSPLLGPNQEVLGTRFPDMSTVYDPALVAMLEQVAARQHIALQQGVYLQFTGPAYETPAEIRMAQSLGADAVGMSTACEAMAAKHMGMRVCGISCITNLAAGMAKVPLNHTEVQETANRVEADFTKLLGGLLHTLREECAL